MRTEKNKQSVILIDEALPPKLPSGKSRVPTASNLVDAQDAQA